VRPLLDPHFATHLICIYNMYIHYIYYKYICILYIHVYIYKNKIHTHTITHPILRHTFLMAVAHTPSFFAASFSGRLKCALSLLALSKIGAACDCCSVSSPYIYIYIYIYIYMHTTHSSKRTHSMVYKRTHSSTCGRPPSACFPPTPTLLRFNRGRTSNP
jgi:hypothetical protein